MSDVLEYHKQGYNCAESVIKAFNEEHDLIFQFLWLVLLAQV